VKNGSFFTFISKDSSQPSSRASILGKGSLPDKQTDQMMLDRVPKMKTDVYPFLLKTSDSAEPIFLAAPTTDSRQAWLQTVVNWVDGPKTISNDPPPEDPAGIPQTGTSTPTPGSPSPSTPGRAGMASTPRGGSQNNLPPAPQLSASHPSQLNGGHGRTSSFGSFNPAAPGAAPGQNPMMTSRAYQNGVQWLIGTPQGPQIKWSSYDPETNDIIEDAFLVGQPEILLTHGVFARGTQGYVISFSQMTQTNSANGASRQIKRMVRKQ
jgi:hypothetical protein